MAAVHRSPAQPHVAFVAFPFGTHAAPLFALARAIAAAAPGAALSFLSTARSLASLPQADGLGNIRLVPIADGTPESSAAPPPASEQAKIGMFLAAMPGSLRALAPVIHGRPSVSLRPFPHRSPPRHHWGRRTSHRP
ncbi:hypothetical protein OPV22_023614 [Ensete ventricosum]|uniref:Anthocyanidin 3-O-glucosyltransferase n=1 Tax=Ensete ventricosum TaxID=4639 RepID=A0AAV8QVY4_ENSVE|nr:hypothetical protein OPV22_023614 [Ensete ventricosum]